MKPKLYIFDMGGVLVQDFDVRPDIYEYLNINEEEFISLIADDFSKYSGGKITGKKFWQVFSERYGSEVNENLFAKFFRPKLNIKTENIIKKLKKETRVVCGTNTIDPHYNYHYSKGQYNIFDKVYASNKIGVSKPDPDFYRYILNLEEVEPKKTVFIDDMEENVAAALSIGIKGILFKDAETLLELI